MCHAVGKITAALALKGRFRCDLSASQEPGCKAVHLAAMGALTRPLERLLSLHPALACSPLSDGRTPLRLALSAPDDGAAAASISIILRADPAVLHTSCAVGRTALHCAVLLGNTKCLRALLSRGARTDTTDAKGYTPLHHAAFLGELQCLQALVEAGADAKAKAKACF